MVTSVVVTRRRHPLEGLSLGVLGRMRRHGRLELLLVLADGSKSLVPAAWTDLAEAVGEPAVDGATASGVAATLGSLADLLDAVAVICAFRVRAEQEREQAARQSPCKEDPRAACAAQSGAGAGSGATPDAVGPASPTAGRRGGQAAGRSDRPSGRLGGEGGRG